MSLRCSGVASFVRVSAVSGDMYTRVRTFAGSVVDQSFLGPGDSGCCVGIYGRLVWDEAGRSDDTIVVVAADVSLKTMFVS